jgi:thiol-disulfide isomerase/thioredoxin
MDRLPTLIAAALVASAAGCEREGPGRSAPSRSRVDAVQAAAPVRTDPREFCEVWHAADAAPPLSLPPLSTPPPTASGRNRWINVWATWCKPCIEELPRLVKWRDELGGKADFELVFLSADGDPAAVREFASAHPEVVGSLELQSADALQPWATRIGVPGQAVLPIHVFVDGKDRVRCVRTAGIGEDDRAAVEQLLMSL